MDFTSATKEQLYQIATDDDVPLSIRYEATRELQGRRFDGDMLPDLVRMWPMHEAPVIADYLGIPTSVVIGMANRYGLIRRMKHVRDLQVPRLREESEKEIRACTVM